jgi:hypothetical protein
MIANLDRHALSVAEEAYWDAKGGTDSGIEAAIVAYLERMRLGRLHETVMAENERLRQRATRPASLQAAE